MTLLQHIQRARDTIAGSSWLQSLPNALATLILILASTQLGLHFWPDSTLVYGIRIDYLAPTVYLLDALILTYLLTTRTVPNKNSRLQVEKGSPAGEGTVLAATPLLPILLINLIYSANPLASLNWSLHFLLYLVFTLSLSRQVLSTMSHLLPITMLFQVILGGIQVVLGHTLQGPLYLLGERAISIGTPNAARATLFGETVLRAYGTLSHPNILAGWLILALLITTHLHKQRDPRSAAQRTLFNRNSWLPAKKGSPAGERSVLVGITFLTTLGVVLTQSRTAALTLFAIIIPFYILPRQFARPRSERTRSVEVFRLRVRRLTLRGRQLSPRFLYFISLLFVICYLLFTGALSRPTDTSLSDRLHLQGVSSQAISSYPVFGAGANASISTYPDISPTTRLLQPDHNSLTLFLSWFGIFGILALLTIILSFKFSVLSFFPLLPLLLLDHYLLTSPQGLFILLLYLRVTISPCPSQN